MGAKLYVEFRELIVQAYLGNIAGLVPEHHNKASITIKRVIIFLLVCVCVCGGAGVACLQFLKKTTSLKLSKAKCNKTIYAYGPGWMEYTL